jgi:hypothetical protein
MGTKNVEIMKAGMNAAVSTVMETKLTRSELIEIVILELEQDIKNKIADVKREFDELNNFSLADLYNDRVSLSFKFCEWSIGSGRRDECRVELAVDGDFKLPAFSNIKYRYAKLAELANLKRELEASLNELTSNKQKAKLNILKKCIETTAEGKVLLASLEQLKLSISAKLLGGGK